jgi:hypothetical protein
MGLIPLGILSSAGGVAFGTYELIQTTILGSTTASVTFSGLATYASVYKHLQLRTVSRDSGGATSPAGYWLRFNGDSANNYAWHRLYTVTSTLLSGSASSTNRILTGVIPPSGNASGVFGPTVIDLLDVYATKNKTIRALGGANTSTNIPVQLSSGVWLSTTSITSLELTTDASFVTGSRFSLYGIR